MRINHNIAALNTHRQLSTASTNQTKSMEKLASGLRINKAGDDAAGLAISEKMRGQIRGLDQASKNAQDGISLVSTAEGALNETHDILQRMRELAVQASSDTNTGVDRGEIQKEINSLTSEINRIGNTTEFNTQKLLNGEKTTNTAAAAASATVGGLTITDASAGKDANSVKIIVNMNSSDALSVTQSDDTITISLATTTAASNNVGAIESALQGLTMDNGVNVSDWTISGWDDGDGPISGVNANGQMAGGADDGTGLQFQIGANENQSMTIEIEDMRAEALGIAGTMGTGTFTENNTVTDGTNNSTNEAALDVSSATNASAAITKIQTAIETVSAERSKLGANQNRLEHTINNLGTSSENLTAAESRIRDVDYALAA